MTSSEVFDAAFFEPVAPALRRCVLESIKEFETIDDDLRLKLTPRTKASIVNDCAVHNLYSLINELGGRAVSSRGQFRFWLSDYYQICFKKLSRQLRPTSAKTHRSRAFLNQQMELEFVVNSRRVQNVILGYRRNRAETEVEVWAVCPDGPENGWEINLDDFVMAGFAEPEPVLFAKPTEKLRRRPAATIKPIEADVTDGKDEE